MWSAGCASGEEVYSLAILLAEALGEGRFRDRVKLYGTDADDGALTQARQARYPRKPASEAWARSWSSASSSPPTAPACSGRTCDGR